MRNMILIVAAVTALSSAVPVSAAAQGNSAKPDKPATAKQKAGRPQPGAEEGQGQGQAQRPKARGQGQSQARGQGQGQVRGQGQAGAQGRGGAPGQARVARRGGPAPDRAAFNRNLVERAVKVRGARGSSARNVEMRREGGELRVVREDGRLLFALDEDRAGEIGYWRIGRVPSVSQARWDDREQGDRRDGGIFPADREASDRPGAPAFCGSGEGHPVWGRAWCMDKGFGLGDGDDRVWGWGREIEDVVLRRPDTDRDLDRGGLKDVLGDIVFGRIALQSLVLGADEPLSGRWIGQENGPRVLSIHAGDLPVAELVDIGRDDEVDVLVFNLGG